MKLPWNRHYAQNRELLQQILATQKCMNNQLKEITEMAASAVTQQQFTTDLGVLQADITTLVTTVNALDANVIQLKADVAALKAANPAVDFSALDASVNQMANTITTANTNVQAEVPAPDAPVPTPAPAPEPTPASAPVETTITSPVESTEPPAA